MKGHTGAIWQMQNEPNSLITKPISISIQFYLSNCHIYDVNLGLILKYYATCVSNYICYYVYSKYNLTRTTNLYINAAQHGALSGNSGATGAVVYFFKYGFCVYSIDITTRMFVTKSINADHKDLIHDVAYDFYGRRMATCSSDQSVKVWDMGEGGQWHCTANFKTHSGSVWKVTWAHPEFGQVIATCSFDRTAAVWEEIIGDIRPAGSERIQNHWVKRTSLVDSRTSVTDIRFAPRHLGLQLATCSADGIVRIYEAPDVMNLSQWSLQHEILCKLQCSCLVWSPSRIHQPMIAVGSDDQSQAGKVLIFEYSENLRRWNKVEVFMSITDPVHDLSFAPNLGRSYHLLAVATKDVRIIILKPQQKDNGNSASSQVQSCRFEICQVGQFDDHKSLVWRVSWNITGTILVTSGDDGYVRLWKANYLDIWKCIAKLKGDNVGSMTDSGTSYPANIAGKF